MSGIDPKLAEITEDDNFRARIAAILAEVRSHGYEDAYIVEAMLDELHLGLLSTTGCATTNGSLHLQLGSDGKCLAADIVPKSTGWNTPKRFWLLLGWACHINEVGWGGLFGLTPERAKALIVAMERLSAKGWPAAHDPDYEVAIGWEEAHCQKEFFWPE